MPKEIEQRTSDSESDNSGAAAHVIASAALIGAAVRRVVDVSTAFDVVVSVALVVVDDVVVAVVIVDDRRARAHD